MTAAALRWANLSLLLLYPVAWAAPLVRARVLPFFSGTEISILSGVAELWENDVILAMIVAIFAVIAPYLKVILLAVIHFGLADGAGWIRGLELAGRLSMADIFLLALYIVLAKGVGVGDVETAWGLYLFTALVLVSMLIAARTPAGAAR